MQRLRSVQGCAAGVFLAVVTLAGIRARRTGRRRLAPLPDGARTCAVIPVVDEAGTIARVIGELRLAGVERIVVVDGGSADGTAELARAAGATVVTRHGVATGAPAGPAPRLPAPT